MAQDVPTQFEAKLDAYAAWIRDLREGRSAAPPAMEGEDPLARLGRELQLLSEAITRRENELRRLSRIVHSAGQEILVEDVLESIFRGFAGIIPYDRIGCAFLTGDGARLISYWSYSLMGPMRINKGYSQRMAGSSLQQVFRTGQPRILNDLEAYLAEHPNSNATARIVAEGGRSSLTCPLFVDGQPTGVLFFTSRQRNTYQDIHQATFLQIADQVSVLINKSRLFQELVDKNRYLQQQAEQLREEASRDPLTGVLNRRAFMLTLERHLQAHAASGQPLGLIMADIDHFKAINDTLGHAAGDRALCEFTRRVGALLRPNDYLGRYGGEEFLLLIDATRREELPAIAERFRRAVAESPFDLGGTERPVTASFGVASASDMGEAPDELVARADRALYAAKAAGRDRCVLAD